MFNLKRKLLAGAITALIASAGAFAQRDKDKQRPPKGDTRVVAGDKRGEKPPQNSNNNNDRNRGGDKKGKP